MSHRVLLRGLIAALWVAGPAAADSGQAAPPVSVAPTPVSPAPAAPAPPSLPGAISVQSLTEAAPPGEAYTLHYGNRPIVEFRARLLGRTPQERARGTVRRLDELVALRLHAPVESKLVGGVAVVTVAGRDAVMVLPADLDASAGETLEAAGRAAAARLALALAEVSEARSPRLLLLDALRALAGTLVALLLGGVLWWLRDRVARRLAAWVDARLVRNLVRDARSDVRRTVEATLVAALRFLSRVIVLGLSAVLLYAWLSFTLRQFPYTRPWGEALRAFVVATLVDLGHGALSALPGLFSVALIVVITRVVVRLANAFFRSVEQGRLSLPGVYAETAQPTRRLAVALLWLLAVVVAYPYLPGSGSDAFKGVSVFVGLMLSLGSSGLVNQAMSSFMITYSRALRLGDFVRIGEVEGTVVHSGVLATKILTPLNEEITLPNAVVASSTITNYSRHSGEGVFMGTVGDDRLRHPVAPGGGAAPAGGRAHRRRAEGTAATRAAVGAQGLLRRVQADRGPRAARPPRARPEPAPRADPGRVQRARRPDHVAELRGRPGDAQARAAGAVVRGTRQAGRKGLKTAGSQSRRAPRTRVRTRATRKPPVSIPST